jgi:L-ribulose-5-phosphate 4-epimerase
MTYERIRAESADLNRRIELAGLVILSFGNVSVADRSLGVFAIKPSGVPYADLTDDDMVVVSIEDGSTVSGSRRPSSDTPTHLILYQRYPDLGGVVHTHSPAAVAWAQAHRPIPCLGTTHADHFDGPVPVTRPLTAAEIDGDYEANTGRVIVELFEADGLDPLHMPGVLVASHGPFTWGATGLEAVTNAVALEAIAGMALDTLALAPDGVPVDDALLGKHFGRKHGPAAYYGQPPARQR